MQPCSLRPVPLVLALALACGVSSLQAQPAPGAEPLPIRIAAQPLAQALNDWARQTGLQIVAPQGAVAGRTAPAVEGRLSPRQALDRLLAGSGLWARFEGALVTVEPRPQGAAPGDAALSTVTVTAAAAAPASPLHHLSGDAPSGALGNRAVLDTPFSLTIVDSEDMARRGARSIGQIFAHDVAVYTPTTSAATDWWGTQIRGLPVQSYYVDDIPMELYWGGDFPTEVVESVTALKGLTGFMYGFGAPGGALSYRLKRAKPQDETTIGLGWRNPGQVSAQLDLNRVTTGGLGVRLNLATDQGEAYNSSRADRKVASLALDKTFGAVDWFANLVYEDNTTKSEPFHFAIGQYQGGQLPRVTYAYERLNVDNSWYHAETRLASTGATWRIDDAWSLKTQFGLARRQHRANMSFAYLLNPGGDYAGNSYNFAGRQDTQFVQTLLQGRVATGALRHEIVAGLGLQRSRYSRGNQSYWRNDFNGNLYQEQTFLTTRTPDFSIGPVTSDARQLYAFLSDTVHFNAHWQAIAGLRYTNYREKDLDGDPAVDSGYGTRKASPTLALVFKPDPRTSLYGSYVQGLEPGTRVGALYANAGELLGATVSRQVELGVKHAAGGVDLTAAVFRIERANQMDDLRADGRYLTQDGLQVFRGIELAGAWQVDRQLNLGLGVVGLNARIDQVSADNAAVQGNMPSGVSKWQAVAHAQYQVAQLPGLRLHASVRHFGPAYTSDQNTLRVPGWTVAGAGFSYDFQAGGQAVTLIGNVQNLFDRKYWSGGGWGAVNLGEARNVSLALRTQF